MRSALKLSLLLLSWHDASGFVFRGRSMGRNIGLTMSATSTSDPTNADVTRLREYCADVTRTYRRVTRTVNVGNVPIGSEHPLALQTMTTTDTRDVAGTVDQVMQCADAGADLVRITVQGRKEAEACLEIRNKLFQKGYDTPLVADIHFQPKVAMLVCEAFEKIRVNPGNFHDGRKTFDEVVYDSVDQFQQERDEIEETFTPLVERCKELNRAMRIGTNHGSLSSRILSFYGDTPLGMVASAIEFAEICRKNNYHDFVFSMKASNPLVMVQAYRLLAAQLDELTDMEKKDGGSEPWNYPLHLGVTEAGEGEDGRMKSAIGIGSLLADGLGDTIRVSLTEDPHLELAPCSTLAKFGNKMAADATLFENIPAFTETVRDYQSFSKRKGQTNSKALLTPTKEDGGNTILHRDGTVFSVVNEDDLRLNTGSSSTDNNSDSNSKVPSATARFDLLRYYTRLFLSLGCRLDENVPSKDIATSDGIILGKNVLRRLAGDKEGEGGSKESRAAVAALKVLKDVGVSILIHSDDVDSSSSSTLKVDEIDWLKELNPYVILPLAALKEEQMKKNSQLVQDAVSDGRYFATVTGEEKDETLQSLLPVANDNAVALFIRANQNTSRVHAARRIFEFLFSLKAELPVLHYLTYTNSDNGAFNPDEFVIQSGSEGGGLLVDGLGDGVVIGIDNNAEESSKYYYSLDYVRRTSFGLLQGSRLRTVKTEFVSCPSCGRTLFDLQEVTAQIQDKTGHLPGVSIAIMGCIVNGPGEMADADFGYVGGAPGKIDLYVGKEVVKRAIDMEGAPDQLVQLIKDHDRWIDPPPKNEQEVEATA